MPEGIDTRAIIRADDAAWEKAQATIIATMTTEQRESWNAEYAKRHHETFSLGFAWGYRFGIKTAIEQMASVAGVK